MPPISLTAPSASALTSQEKLLLSQAIHKLGAADWSAISALLLAHPCIKPRDDATKVFSADGCEGMYKELMGQIGQNVPAPDGMKPASKTHLRLAQTFYLARMTELQSVIAEYEKQFAVVVGEIARLKSGELDEEIRAELRGVLARKYGKRLLDSWVPEVADVKAGLEAGAVQPGEEESEVQRAEDERKVAAKQEEKPGAADEEAHESEGEAVAKGDTDGGDAAMAVDPPPEDVAEDPSASDVEKEEQNDQALKEEEAQEEEEEEPKPRPPSSKGRKRVQSPTPVPVDVEQRTPSPPISDLSPPPSIPQQQHETRHSKRKASAQPRGAPPSKRAGGRRSATSPAATVPESEHLSDVGGGGDEEDLLPRRGGRRQSRRGKAAGSPAGKDKDSSPAVSRRAPSVSSTTSQSHTAQGEEKPAGAGAGAGRGGAATRRGMRDSVVSRSVREISERSVKEEVVHGDEEEQGGAEEEEEEEEEERKGRGSGRRGTRGAEEKEAVSRKPKRGSTVRTPVPPDGDDEHLSVKGEGKKVKGRQSMDKDGKASQKMLYSLLDVISGHKNGNVFQGPVKKSDAPDYYDVIKRPMDLKTLRQRIRDGQVTSIDEFERDVLLMFANAMMYNESGSQVYEMAEDMLKESENHIARFRSMAHDLGR